MNDETLTLYFYRDGLSRSQRAAVQAALENDADLRKRYERLREDLAAIVTPAAPALPADMTARWKNSIERAARLDSQQHGRRSGKVRRPTIIRGFVIAATLVLGVGMGMLVSTRPTLAPDAGIAANGLPQASPSEPLAFERGLQVHLRESRQTLAGPPDNGARSQLALQIVQRNRAFERVAEQNNATDLARVLRAFEPILLRLAEDDISQHDAEALQAQLTFEFNVMLTKLGRPVSEVTGPI